MTQEVVVTSPELWPASKEVKDTTYLDSNNSQLAFEIRALSYGEYADFADEYPVPKPPVREMRGIREDNYDDAEFLKAQAHYSLRRMVSAIDSCWKPFTGTTLEEKTSWVETNINRPGELIALYNAIMDLSGLKMGEAVQLDAKPISITADPDVWAKQSKSRSGYKMTRAGASLVWELVGISRLQQNQITAMTPKPEPPLRPIDNAVTGRRVSMAPDANDPAYRKALILANRQEDVLTLEASLFQLPGSTVNDKYQWLRERPAFEVHNLLYFLSTTILSYQSRSDFTSRL